MAVYIIKRVLLIFPTLFGIILINFIIVQFAPGGPVEQTSASSGPVRYSRRSEGIYDRVFPAIGNAGLQLAAEVAYIFS